MSTKAKNALAERIRSVLAHDNSTDLTHATVAALAEAAILLEVQCEEMKLLYDLIPILVTRLIPSRDDGGSALPDFARVASNADPSKCNYDFGTSEEVALFRAMIEHLKSTGADSPERFLRALEAIGIDSSLRIRILNCAVDAGYLRGDEKH